MSEVEQAREHLRQCQARLRMARGCVPEALKDSLPWSELMQPASRQFYEQSVLAAISWLWDAQQREIMQEGVDALRVIVSMRGREQVTTIC